MAGWALILFGLYFALAIALRTLLQWRRTGSSGFKGISGRPGSAEWTGGVLFAVALAMGVSAPVLDLAGALEPLAVLDGGVGHALGLALYGAGLSGTIAAQATMGASWRIGVDETERTDLVTGGPFALVRNPIYATMIPTSAGLVLLVPNLAALAGLLALATALQLQTRLVEEPHLLQAHGPIYAQYASRVGRFLPGLGRRRARGN